MNVNDAMLEFANEMDTFLCDEEYEAMITIEDNNRRCERVDKIYRLRKANSNLIGALMHAQQLAQETKT